MLKEKITFRHRRFCLYDRYHLLSSPDGPQSTQQRARHLLISRHSSLILVPWRLPRVPVGVNLLAVVPDRHMQPHKHPFFVALLNRELLSRAL